MVKICALFLFLLSSKITASEYPDPRAWAEKLPESLWTDTIGLIRNVCIFSDDDESTEKWQKVLADFSGLAFLQYLDPQTMQFTNRLNPKNASTFNMSDLPLGLMAVHLILHDEGRQVRVQVPGKAKLKNLGMWTITEDDKQSSEQVLAWITRNIGYDAIVLDKRNNLLLVALMTPNNELGQGILIHKSKSKWVLKPEKIRGEALLQMVRVEGSLAVFEVLLKNRAEYPIEIGSKVILGQNHNLDKLLKTINPVENKAK